MISSLNETHDSQRRSWVNSANTSETDFPLQNLPYCVFRRDAAAPASVGVGIGDQILDLAGIMRSGLIDAEAGIAEAAAQPALNSLMALDPDALSQLRLRLFRMLDSESSEGVRARAERFLVPMDTASLDLPAEIGDYTDFLTSASHTERHGRFKGLQDPLPKAFYSLPIAYHGRASSIRVSGTKVVRPRGQFESPRGSGRVQFGPSEAMDFELELAAFIGQSSDLACPIPVADAARHIFGYALLNDWSAKDIQWWEQVLGPFLGKSFMTSLSPWVVTAEALTPFRGPLAPRPPYAGPVMPHLGEGKETLDLRMEAWLCTARVRAQGGPGVLLSRTSPTNLSWSFEQMLAHHTSNGCNLRTADLIGSGTISGSEASAMGCMTEMTAAGKNALELPNGERRHWLQDGDEVVFRARATRDGFASIGFGECRGVVVPT
jgi:fumarylacetoacetase